jgi:bacillithiol system protein YtxJ
MSANLVNLESVEKLESLIEESHQRPVILFKHSNSCGISSGVFSYVKEINADVNLVVVQSHRGVSDEIARRTGVVHQSPQAIVLSKGEPVYHASHYDVDPGNIAAVMAAE